MNIAKILKDAPKGTKLYSSIYGYVELLGIDDLEYPIRAKTCNNGLIINFAKDGKCNIDYPDGECVLFPSKDNRDWNTFKVEKSYEFKPFDKVLVRGHEDTYWTCDHFSHMYKKNYICSGDIAWEYCIPYNDDTKHLVGTSEPSNY